MDERTIRKAERELTILDPILGTLIASQTLTPRTPRTNYFESLCRSIIGQQVSVAAANAISKRFEVITKLDPAVVATLSEEKIKEIGLSKQKAGYLRDLSEHFVKDPGVYNHLDKQTDEQVIEELIAVKGIGPWTAQMFMMSTLARPDVFAPDDAGLQRGMKLLYKWDKLPPKKELTEFAERWSPYRSIASLHLWHSLDNDPGS